MGKTYVDMEKLEELFRQYNIPYTNIFDEIKTMSAEEIAGNMSVHELRDVLEKKEEVFATQIWQKADIYAAMNVLNITPELLDNETVARIMSHAKAPLEDCSDNWDRLHVAIKDCVAGGIMK